MFVALYKGVLFSRKTTFIWLKPPKDATGGTGDSGGDTETTGSSGGTGGTGEASFSFKQKLSAKIVKFPASGSEVEFAEFPITIFACSDGGEVAGATGDSGEGSIIYCDDAMTSFKKFGQLKETEFYRNATGDAASDFVLPMPDATRYDVEGGSGSSSSDSGGSGGTGDKGVVEEIKRGLLTPLWRINVKKTSTDSLIVDEVLNLHTSDTFFFEERQLPGATGGTGGTGDTGGTGGTGGTGETGENGDNKDPCAKNGEGGGDGSNGTGGAGSLGPGGEGWLETHGPGGGEPGKSPCPDDADSDFDYSGIDT